MGTPAERIKIINDMVEFITSGMGVVTGQLRWDDENNKPVIRFSNIESAKPIIDKLRSTADDLVEKLKIGTPITPADKKSLMDIGNELNDLRAKAQNDPKLMQTGCMVSKDYYKMFPGLPAGVTFGPKKAEDFMDEWTEKSGCYKFAKDNYSTQDKFDASELGELNYLDLTEAGTGGGLPTWALILIIVVSVIAVVALTVFVAMKAKKKGGGGQIPRLYNPFNGR